METKAVLLNEKKKKWIKKAIVLNVCQAMDMHGY